MRTSDGRIAGAGINLAFNENNEFWRDKKVWDVRFPNDGIIHIAEITYKTIDELDEETKLKYNLY